MSVAQVKKRFSEFESYLRKDTEGLRRLKLLKDDVNVLRTSLADAIEAKEAAEVIKDAARERADKSETALRTAEQNVESMASVAKSLESKVAILTEQLRQAEDVRTKERAEPADKEASMKKMIKDLASHIERCPKSPRNGGKISSDTMWFNKSDFCTGYSRKEIWALGAAVAAIVSVVGQFVIFTDETFGDMLRKNRLHSAARPFLRWFKGNIRPDGVDQLWESLTEAQRAESNRRKKEEDTHAVIYGEDVQEPRF